MTSQTLSPSLASLIQKHNLDFSIVEAKDLERTSRIDAEFFQKKYLTTLKNL